MDNLILSFTVVFPLFAQLVRGYGLKRIKLLDDHTLSVCNKLVFRVFLPCLLFLNVYRANLAQVFNARLLAWAAAVILVCFCALMVLVPLFEKDPKKRGVLVQGIFRSNFALFGVPVAVSLFGQENSGVASILTVVVIPMFNMLSVVALEVFRGGKPNAGRMLLGIAKNPLILSTLTGLLLLLLDVSLPQVLVDALDDISQVATPLSLVVLGGSFEFSKLRGSLREMAIGVLGRLVVVPAVFLPLFACGGAMLSVRMLHLQQLDSTARGTISTLTSAVMYLGTTVAGLIGGPLLTLTDNFTAIGITAFLLSTISALMIRPSRLRTEVDDLTSIHHLGEP